MTMTKSHEQVFFIGLDGGEPELIRRWMADGSLPTLARLYGDGISGDVSTLPGMGDGAVWPTLITGVNPARHGRYFRVQTKPRSYKEYKFEIERDLRWKPFWYALSHAGRRVAILDLPYAPGTSSLNGVLLTDWLIHDRYGSPRGYPTGFASDVLSRFGDDPINGDSDAFSRGSSDVGALQELLIQRVRMKASLVAEVQSKGPWNLIFTAFTEPHDIGHIAWSQHDPHNRHHDSALFSSLGDPIKNLYIAIDQEIGRLIDLAGNNATIVIFAGLGMGPNYTANGLMDRILARIDRDGHLLRSRLAKTFAAAGKPRMMVKLASLIDPLITRHRYSRRRFFFLPHNENSGAIRINLMGREPRGRVKPEDYDRVCRELTDIFMELRDPITRMPIVKEVVKVSDRPDYHGPFLEALPDLFVVWNRESPFNGVESSRIGRIDGAKSWGRTGDHTPHAMLIIKRPGLPPGTLKSTPHIVDIAPTVAKFLDVQLENSDGRAIQEITVPVSDQ